ncbi:NAD(P)-binding protein [Penicillium sp. IBT 16267x]|nr:NAD(P)-binding protein [Penicillium sp. IBT 16267x]
MSTKKRILLTGCSANGIGAALALALARKGHHIFATARKLSKIPESLVSLSNVTSIQLDVTSPESITEAVRVVEDHGMGLDVLINNAGIGYTMPLLDVDIKIAQRTYDTNVWGVLRITQAFAPLLLRSRGKIVTLSSIGGVTSTPWIGIYTSSKSAITTISETLRLELAPLGINVLTVMVGTVTTSFHSNEPEFSIPSSSHFLGAGDTIAQWASGQAGPKGCPVQAFADSIVDDIMGKSGMIWRGSYSKVLWFASKWMPQWLWDYLLSDQQGLDNLVKA